MMLRGTKKEKEDSAKQDIGSFTSVLTPPKAKSKIKKLNFFRQDPSETSPKDLSLDVEPQAEKAGQSYKDALPKITPKTSNLKNVAQRLDLADAEDAKKQGAKVDTKKSSSKSVTFREAEIFIIASTRNNRVKDRISFDIAILFIGHLLKYADKFAIAGVRNELERYFNIGRRELLTFRTICLVSLVVASPVFGYFGDRLKRKQVVSIGIFACSIMTYSSSFVPANMFGLFIFCQMLVSIGEASFCIMVLSMIADLFQGSMRSLAFTLYCMAIPLGSGFGYTFAKKVTSLTRNWKWSFRISPVVGVACSAFIWFSMEEPRKGSSDGRYFFRNTSLFEDLKYIFKHRTFIFLTLGASCVSFVFGAMAVWGPLHIYNSAKAFDSSITLERVTMTFELITCISGVGGVLFGYIVCTFSRKYISDADSIVCGMGMLLNGFLTFVALGYKRQSLGVTWICIFYSQLFIYTNVAIVSDILMYTIVPTRRSLATSLQMFISHMLGDVGSPYIIASVPFSIYVTCFVAILGGIFFFTTSVFRGTDRRNADEWIRRGSRRRSSMLQDIQQLSMVSMDSGQSRNPSSGNPELGSGLDSNL